MHKLTGDKTRRLWKNSLTVHVAKIFVPVLSGMYLVCLGKGTRTYRRGRYLPAVAFIPIHTYLTLSLLSLYVERDKVYVWYLSISLESSLERERQRER